MLCREVALVKNLIGGKIVMPLRCKCWHCAYCKPMRQRQLAEKGRNGKPTTFLTLTVNPAMFENEHERARKLKWAWEVTRRAIKRRWRVKSVPFMAVFEKTQKGEPHLHILARLPFIHQVWLSAQMQRLIGAPVVDIRRVRTQKGVARYVSKYVSEEPQPFEGCKRYWSSHDWELKKREKVPSDLIDGEFWSRPGLHPMRVIEWLVECGWVCTLQHDGETWHALPRSRAG